MKFSEFLLLHVIVGVLCFFFNALMYRLRLVRYRNDMRANKDTVVAKYWDTLKKMGVKHYDYTDDEVYEMSYRVGLKELDDGKYGWSVLALAVPELYLLYLVAICIVWVFATMYVKLFKPVLELITRIKE